MSKHKNQSGFSTVEMVIVFVIVALIGAVGWYVWHNKTTTKETTTKSKTSPTSSSNKSSTQSATLKEKNDETANWLAYKHKDDSYSIKIPDGWKLSLDSLGLLYGYNGNLIYSAGTKAIITPQEGASVGEKTGLYISAGKRQLSNSQQAEDFAAANVTGKKFTFTVREDGVGESVGDKQYTFYFEKGDKAVQVFYKVHSSETDFITDIERAVRTLAIN